MKRLISLMVLCILALTFFSVPASAAFVTDGNELYLAGDVTDDGNLDILDLVGASIGKGKTAAADLDGDGAISAYDLALIRAMILGIDNSEWTE